MNGHLGLGFETALTAVTQEGWRASRVARLITSETQYGSILCAGPEDYFELERFRDDGSFPCRRGFAVVMVVEGNVQLTFEATDSHFVQKGHTTVVPHADEALELRGHGEVIIARPPDAPRVV